MISNQHCRIGALKEFIVKNLLMVITLVSVVFGFAIGFGLREVELTDGAKMWLAMPGHCFLNLLKITIVPLITCSVITAVSTMNPKQNGRLVGIQLAYLLLTNLMGSTLGTLIGVALQRTGPEADDAGTSVVESKLETGDVFADLIRNIFPENIVRVTMQKAQTVYKEIPVAAKWDANNTALIRNASVIQERSWAYTDDMNLLGLMLVCFVFGLAASSTGERGKPFIAFFSSATEIILTVLQWFIWVAPVGVLFLMIVGIAGIEDLRETFSRVGFFVLAVVVGIVAHQLICLPVIYLIALRSNPFRLYPYSVEPWLVAFASGSSACAMPFIYKMVDKPEVCWTRKAANFAIPTAVTINADGSALYICNAVFFMAQLTGTAMGVGNIFIVWALTSMTAMALPAIPSASIVSVIVICSSMGIPTTHLGLLFTVEWILDRLRTTSNVLGEIISVSFVNHYYLKSLENSEDSQVSNEIEAFLPEKGNNNDSMV